MCTSPQGHKSVTSTHEPQQSDTHPLPRPGHTEEAGGARSQQ